MKLFLNGGGSGKDTLDCLNVFFNYIDKSKPILYIPIAMDENENPYDECLKWLEGEFKPFNFSNIVMIKNFDLINYKTIENYSGIFIGGGNTFKLLKEIKESSAFEAIKHFTELDRPIYGGSAGAIIFGKDIKICKKDKFNLRYNDENNLHLEDTRGFDFIEGFSIMAHFHSVKSENERQDKKFNSLEGKIIALTEKDSLFISDHIITIIGQSNEVRIKQ